VENVCNAYLTQKETIVKFVELVFMVMPFIRLAQNVCVTFWDHSLECVILPLDNALVYLTSLGCPVMSVNPIIGKLLVEMDVNRAIVIQSDLFLNNVTSLMGNVNVNLALEELNVINVKQIIGVIQTMNAMLVNVILKDQLHNSVIKLLDTVIVC
jgi:hypothetical protein